MLKGGIGALPEQARRAPGVCWRPERVESDLALAGRLMAKLDAEKGIEANPVAAAHAPADGAPEGAHGHATPACSITLTSQPAWALNDVIQECLL